MLWIRRWTESEPEIIFDESSLQSRETSDHIIMPILWWRCVDESGIISPSREIADATVLTKIGVIEGFSHPGNPFFRTRERDRIPRVCISDISDIVWSLETISERCLCESDAHEKWRIELCIESDVVPYISLFESSRGICLQEICLPFFLGVSLDLEARLICWSINLPSFLFFEIVNVLLSITRWERCELQWCNTEIPERINRIRIFPHFKVQMRSGSHRSCSWCPGYSARESYHITPTYDLK